ncbi:MAG: hypothetical protein ABJC24_03875 [Chloroflexota bacterium]
MARRSDEDRLRLLDIVMDRIAAEPALQEPFSVKLTFEGNELSQEVSEPSRPNLRSLLMEVRKLDAPGDDVYLPELLDIIASRASEPAFQQGLKDARAHYDRMQASGDLVIRDDEGPMSPRQAFELWAYGEHLHDDAQKVQRIEKMHPMLRAYVRSAAVGYMDGLIRIAAYARRVVRNDPGLT